MREEHARNRRGVARDEIDHARRQTGFLQQLHQVVRREHRACRRLPHDGVAHERGRGRQVGGNRREVERRDGVDESFERAVVQLIPRPALAQRLLAGQFMREVRVEAPEIDDLARGIDFGLHHRLALPEHRRAVERVAPRRGEQIRGLQKHRGAILERPARPFLVRGERGVHGLGHERRRRLVIRGEHVAVVVRHHGLLNGARADVFAADDDGNVDLFAGHLREPRLERRAFRRARLVRSNRLVDGVHQAILPPAGATACVHRLRGWD